MMRTDLPSGLVIRWGADANQPFFFYSFGALAFGLTGLKKRPAQQSCAGPSGCFSYGISDPDTAGAFTAYVVFSIP